MEQYGTAGVSASEYGKTDEVAGFYFSDVFRQGYGAAGAAGVSASLDVHEEAFFGYVGLPGDGFDDALVCLVGGDPGEVLYGFSVGAGDVLERFCHVVAGVDEYVSSFGHADASVEGAQVYGFVGFADVSESAGVDVYDAGVVAAVVFAGDEEGDGSVAPEVAALGVGFVGVCRVVFRADDERLGGFAHGEVALCDFKGVDEG